MSIQYDMRENPNPEKDGKQTGPATGRRKRLRDTVL